MQRMAFSQHGAADVLMLLRRAASNQGFGDLSALRYHAGMD